MKRVLIVDDDPDIRESLEDLLQERFDVTCACNGRSALEKVDEMPIDAVVLDLAMPILDGAGFMRGLSERSIRPKVIIASANGDIRELAQALGAVDYLPKPFQAESLEQKLLRALH